MRFETAAPQSPALDGNRLPVHNGRASTERTDMHLLIAIPALNEEASIAHVVQGVPTSIEGFRQISIVVLDDGSTDSTASTAAAAGAEVRRHGKSRGVAHAFRESVQLALERRMDALVMIDGDGQFNPADISTITRPISAGEAEFVAADRFSGITGRPPDMPAAKYVGNRLMNSLIRWITGTEATDVSSGFRAYSREALFRLNVHSSFTYTQETFLDLATKGVRVQQVPITVRYYPGRRSRVVTSIWRYAVRSFSTIFRTVRDNRPFFVFGFPATGLALAGIALEIVPVVHFLREGSFSPYIFMALTGAYLFTLGLVLAIVALASDMLRPIRKNQEMLLYLSKRAIYGHQSPHASPVSDIEEIPENSATVAYCGPNVDKSI